MNSDYKLTLQNRSINDAEPEVKNVLSDTEQNMGFIPNMYAAMANAPILLNTYATGYKLFREQSGFSAVEQEVIFLAISRENECDYCMAAHSFVADEVSNVDKEITDAIRNDEEIADSTLAALVRFTKIMVKTRGLPSVSDVEAFIAAGYSEIRVLEIIQAISVKTISNYSNHLFHTKLDDVFEGSQWSSG